MELKETTQENKPHRDDPNLKGPEGKTIEEGHSENSGTKRITKDTTFAEVMQEHPNAREELFSMGLGCGGCPMAQMESIEGGAHAHGINPEALLEELNNRLVDKNNEENTEQTTKEEQKTDKENNHE